MEKVMPMRIYKAEQKVKRDEAHQERMKGSCPITRTQWATECECCGAALKEYEQESGLCKLCI